MQKVIFYRQIQFLIHLCLWTIIIHFLFAIDGLYYSFLDLIDPQIGVFDEAFILIPFVIGLFYVNYSFLAPSFLNKQYWIKYSVLLISSFFTYFFCSRLLFSYLHKNGIVFQGHLQEIFDIIPFGGILILAISTSIFVSRKLIINESVKLEAEERQKEAEINFLSAQITPHFLFNSLNTIYSITEQEEATRSSDSVLKLSEMMRYPINEGIQKEVPINAEINFLKNYLDFQKIKLGGDYPIIFNLEGDFENKRIAPLLFISIVENTFKYGVSHQYKYPILLSLSLKNNKLTFNSKNQIVNKKNQSHKLGISNLTSRLELIYPDKYSLTIDQDNKTHEVSLEILFDE